MHTLGTSSSSERLGGIDAELRSFLHIMVTHLLRQERGRNMLKGLSQYADYFSLLGDGRGGFAPVPGSPFAIGSNPTGITRADINRDKNRIWPRRT